MSSWKQQIVEEDRCCDRCEKQLTGQVSVCYVNGSNVVCFDCKQELDSN